MEDINQKTFDDLTKSTKYLVVDYYANWCQPCKTLSPIIESVEKELPDVLFKKVDVDNNEDLAVSNSVRGLPTVVFYKEGVEVDRLTGLTSGSDLVSRIAKAFTSSD